MPRTSIAEILSFVNVLIAGLRANQEQMAKRGISPEFVTELETLKNEVIELNNEQEALKAKLKEKTDLIEAKLGAIEKKSAEAKKIVKIEVAQNLWKEYGITDQR